MRNNKVLMPLKEGTRNGSYVCIDKNVAYWMIAWFKTQFGPRPNYPQLVSNLGKENLCLGHRLRDQNNKINKNFLRRICRAFQTHWQAKQWEKRKVNERRGERKERERVRLFIYEAHSCGSVSSYVTPLISLQLSKSCFLAKPAFLELSSLVSFDTSLVFELFFGSPFGFESQVGSGNLSHSLFPC